MLTISRTPVRISFFGGGTDYPAFFQNAPGAVVGTTINKYIYITSVPMVHFADSLYRLTYRHVEHVDDIADIGHPIVRTVLSEIKYYEPLSISILSDVPAGTGLGSSSAFTVGFLKLVHHLKGVQPTRYDLAKEAIRVEHELLNENVGIQDQLHAAFGGFSKYSFHKDDLSITPVRVHTEARDALNSSMLLVYAGKDRAASEIAKEQIQNTKAGTLDGALSHMLTLTEQAVGVFEQSSPDQVLKDIGALLCDGWRTKRALSSSVTSPKIDEIFETGIELGAYGGKLCGAGGGGFFLFLAPPESHPALSDAFGERYCMRIQMEESGATVVHG